MTPYCRAPGCHDVRTTYYGMSFNNTTSQHVGPLGRTLVAYLGQPPTTAGVYPLCRIHALQRFNAAMFHGDYGYQAAS